MKRGATAFLPMPRIDMDAAAVVVVRTRIEEGAVKMEHGPAEPLHLQPGQKLIVYHTYEFDEGAWRREAFAFGLDARPDKEDAHHAETILHNHLFLASHGKGSVSVAHRFQEPGRHVLAFSALAEYHGGSWSRTDTPTERKTATGRLTVIVAKRPTNG